MSFCQESRLLLRSSLSSSVCCFRAFGGSDGKARRFHSAFSDFLAATKAAATRLDVPEVLVIPFAYAPSLAPFPHRAVRMVQNGPISVISAAAGCSPFSPVPHLEQAVSSKGGEGKQKETKKENVTPQGWNPLQEPSSHGRMLLQSCKAQPLPFALLFDLCYILTFNLQHPRLKGQLPSVRR